MLITEQRIKPQVLMSVLCLTSMWKYTFSSGRYLAVQSEKDMSVCEICERLRAVSTQEDMSNWRQDLYYIRHSLSSL